MPIRAAVRRLDLPRGLWLALAAIVLSLVSLIALQMYEAFTRSPQLAHDRALITHTFEVIAAAQTLSSTARDAERAQRAYLLTGEPGFLETYPGASQQMPAVARASAAANR